MAIINSTMLAGPTISVTGGTSKTYAPDGRKVANGLSVSDFSPTDFRLAPVLACKNRPSQYNEALGTYSMGKKESVHTFPFLLASGKIAFPNVRIVIEDHPEMTNAMKDEMHQRSLQLLSDPDFADYRRNGVLA